MMTMRLFVLAIVATVFTGCATSSDGTRAPDNSEIERVKEKRSWDAPTL
jgi:hypothetical protein